MDEGITGFLRGIAIYEIICGAGIGAVALFLSLPNFDVVDDLGDLKIKPA